MPCLRVSDLATSELQNLPFVPDPLDLLSRFYWTINKSTNRT